MRTFLLAAAAAIITYVLPATPGQGAGPDGPPLAVRAAEPAPTGSASRGRPVPRPAPASTSKSATPHLRLSLKAAVENAKSAGETGQRGRLHRRPNPLTPADAVGWCESRNRYDAENPTSSASGRWQFIASTWTWITGLTPPASAWPPSVQRAAFLTLWDNGRGARHWAPSRDCWEPLLAGGRP